MYRVLTMTCGNLHLKYFTTSVFKHKSGKYSSQTMMKSKKLLTNIYFNLKHNKFKRCHNM